MSNITEIREENAKFNLHINDNMPEMFTDGVSKMIMGTTISKLTFHSVTNPIHPNSNGNEIEERKGILLLTIPTPILLEMCRNILATAQSSIDAFRNVGERTDAQIRNIMKSVSIEVTKE